MQALYRSYLFVYKAEGGNWLTWKVRKIHFSFWHAALFWSKFRRWYFECVRNFKKRTQISDFLIDRSQYIYSYEGRLQYLDILRSIYIFCLIVSSLTLWVLFVLTYVRWSSLIYFKTSKTWNEAVFQCLENFIRSSSAQLQTENAIFGHLSFMCVDL
jgi:hypothetical protein